MIRVGGVAVPPGGGAEVRRPVRGGSRRGCDAPNDQREATGGETEAAFEPGGIGRKTSPHHFGDQHMTRRGVIVQRILGRSSLPVMILFLVGYPTPAWTHT